MKAPSSAQEQSGIGESRSFTYLGPNIASLDSKMNGTVVMADATNVRSWYFGNGFNDDRTVPSPVIEATEGEIVRVTLDANLPHTIHFHGLDVDQANDGVPNTSGYVSEQPAAGGFGRVDGYTHLGTPFEYTFVAPQAGTYSYHCHVDTAVHMEMGMIGTVIVRPPGGSATEAWSGGPSFDHEFLWHLHTFDSSWHVSGQIVSGPANVRHRPDFFMINGRDGANTLNDSTTAIRGIPDGGRVLIRATNIGYQPAMVDLGGLMFDVIASDGRPLVSPLTTDHQLLAPGERYDLLLTVPAGTDSLATVAYYDIRLANVLGTATTKISSEVPVFEDGFESGDPSAWTSSTP